VDEDVCREMFRGATVGMGIGTPLTSRGVSLDGGCSGDDRFDSLESTGSKRWRRSCRSEGCRFDFGALVAA